MGITRLAFTVSHPIDAQRSARVELLVDTGAMISFVPGEILEKLGIPRQSRRAFRMANGQVIQRDTGGAMFAWNGYASVGPVVFGDPGDEALLGVTALEAMGLQVDPINKTLNPTDLLAV
jgi:clan AA aspartic protease